MKRIIILILLLPFSLPLFAHPHIRLSTSLEFEYSDRQCSGIWVEWEFDRFFSISIINDFDLDKNGEFDSSEVNDIEQHAFSNLKNYGYFIYLRIGTKRYNSEKVSNFSAQLFGSKLHYRFFIPLNKQNYNDFYVSVFDPTYYCAVDYIENGVIVGQGFGTLPELELLENKDDPVYYNPYGAASDMTAYTKWEPGLQTAYPKEVHVYFPE
ncbi:MAG: DUF1007 family protein [Spirochaetota bacterium]|nr:DUF1007 family protein [Spirochaetota bacterium]